MQGLRISAPTQELNINDPDYDYGNVWPLNVNAISRTAPRGNSDPRSGWRNLSWANKPNGTKRNIRKLAENVNYAYSEPLTSDKYSRYRQLYRKFRDRKLLPSSENILAETHKDMENRKKIIQKRVRNNNSNNSNNIINNNNNNYNNNNNRPSNAKRQTIHTQRKRKSRNVRKARKARKSNKTRRT
jgi:hypothetical protein